MRTSTMKKLNIEKQRVRVKKVSKEINELF